MLLTRYAAVATLFLAPSVLVEFLTGNATIAVFADPISLVMLFGSYGSGAVLARELTRRWQKGFASILILGAVYGMFNEGLQTGGFFDPHFYAVASNALENYGRWGGVNVVWALEITIFHAVFSIAVPIIIVDALFPSLVYQRLLGNMSLLVFLILLLMITVAQRMILTFRQPPINPYAFIFLIVLMLLLTLSARAFPSSEVSAPRRTPSNTILFVSTLIASVSWLIVIPRLLAYIHLPIVDTFTIFGLLYLISWFLLGFASISSRNRVAIAAGAEGPLIVHAMLSAIFVPAAITLAVLFLAWRRSREEIGRRPVLAPSTGTEFSGGSGPR